MDIFSYIFYRLGNALLQVWNIPVTMFGYTVKFGAIIIWCMIASVMIKFVKDMTE